ncbi:hypothetical protein MMIC_P1959 [Mariprofundus micogutta]|uniref:Uncharacterized protein n=1 Tax=Mariprofundus micogutta TaxID=1921010 RepID=A0A1L8CPY5_9PROT|nr:hypothetical protein [Mariprofundus micogutta]GAV20981.1 hypothetical protein MMIC_P1959 [Mariprofundus micogutta]
MSKATDKIGLIEIEYIRRVIGLTFVVTIVFDVIYLFLGRADLFALTLLESVVFAVALWLIHIGKVRIAMHMAAFVLSTAVIIQCYLEPSTGFWISVMMVGIALFLGREGLVWSIYTFSGLLLMLYLDAVRELPLFSLQSRMNLLISLGILFILNMLFFAKLKQQQQDTAQVSEQLAGEKAERKKMEMARNLAGGLAHLINNEMQAVSLNTHLIRLESDEETGRKLDQIDNIASKASLHANQLLAYSGYSQKCEFESLDLHGFLDDCIEEYRVHMPPSISLQLSASDKQVCSAGVTGIKSGKCCSVCWRMQSKPVLRMVKYRSAILCRVSHHL